MPTTTVSSTVQRNKALVVRFLERMNNADLDAAIAIAKKVPLVADGAIEVRPIMDLRGLEM